MDDEISKFVLEKVFPLFFWIATLYFVISIIYVFYYFFIRKTYRYVEDHSKEEACLVCTEANCLSKQNKCNHLEEELSPKTLYNEKIKIKSNLDLIEERISNLRPNNIEETNDFTLAQDKTIINTIKGSHKSSKSVLSNTSNSTYVNSIDDKKNCIFNKSINKSIKSINSSKTNLMEYQYGQYGNTVVYGGKIKNNKGIEKEKQINVYKSINKNNNKAYQNYVSFNNVFKERSLCKCECHNKEYTKIRVKFGKLDFLSKNNHEFMYWSFFICLQLCALMIMLFGLYNWYI
ncbi:hypothetical protein BCR32DRAFT_245784 [Anaeromyces robustus]|uniref:Uncharacterized protein n=1 Tax=Anaeromyces robustus TaxID=1754192 RepID=A0A1Y1X326_9FUNG|nr:hypothetical protein BCR32DRAFT_245784 [Anaeromyces robustus]|eukprot:ORX80207.1 hypothetical protein BCR32DRAFT_245784 [Anaeromyces robustus]